MRKNQLLLLALVLVPLAACLPTPPVPCTSCGDRCVDLSSDSANCGACGAACGAGERCQAGACAVTCGAGQSMCGSRCTDVSTDSSNCGACGTSCAAGERCQAGACTLTCGAGLATCGAQCVDLSSSPAHCGACGTSCSAGERCEAGACVPTCGSPMTTCSGACVDTNSSPAHCGGCGMACMSGETCVGGSCIQLGSCGTQTRCGAECVTTTSDERHCGGCNVACAGDERCVNSACTRICSGAATSCDGGCAVTANDPQNCGACNRVCGSGQFCSSGTCTNTCAFTACGNGSCVDTQRDPGNCGGCGTLCPTPPHTVGICQAGACGIGQCDRGYRDCNGDPSDGCECLFTLISVAIDGGQANADSTNPSVDDTGTLVGFVSAASNLVSDDTNGVSDYFLRDLRTNTTTRLSVGPGGVELPSGASSGFVSADGRTAVFVTNGAAILPDTNGATIDVIVVDLVTGRRTYGLLGVDGGQPQGTGNVFGATQLSSNGQQVLHSSQASQLFPGDTVQAASDSDVFVFDRSTSQPRVASLGADGGFVTNGNAPYHSSSSFFSGNGRFVSFSSSGWVLEAPSDTCTHVYVSDMSPMRPVTTRVAQDDGGLLPCTLADRRSAVGGLMNDLGTQAFFSSRTEPSTGATGTEFQLYRRDVATGRSALASRNRFDGGAGNGFSIVHWVDVGGRRVSFLSFANNLVSGDSNGNKADCFVWHSDGGIDFLSQPVVNAMMGGPAACGLSRLSRSGEWAVLEVYDGLVVTDTNDLRDIYLRRTP